MMSHAEVTSADNGATSSDEESYNPNGPAGSDVWTPNPSVIAELYEKLDKVLGLMPCVVAV